MTIAISLLGGFFLCGLFFMLVELRDAPEGCQDQAGFHLTWQNNNPEMPNVSCIWKYQSQVSAVADSAGLRKMA